MALVEKTLPELESVARLSHPVWYRGGTVALGGLPLVFTIGGGPTFFGLNFDEFFDPATVTIRASALPDLSGLYELAGAVVIHTAISGAHHTAFTQTDADLLYEALGDIAVHAAIAGVHHASFVQADADLLYEALGDIAIHTAITGAHHAEAHQLEVSGGPHTGTLPWGELSKTGSSLADIATRAHANLSDAPPTAHHDNANDPTSDQKDALAGTSGTPSSSNKYVTQEEYKPIDLIIDGGGADITTGVKGYIRIWPGLTVIGWSLGGDNALNEIVVDVWMDSHANYPPTVADTMVGGGNTKPALSGAITAEDDPVDWDTTDIPAGYWLCFNVDSVGGTKPKRVTIALKVQRT